MGAAKQKLQLVLFLLSVGICSATPIFFGLSGGTATSTGSSITVGTNWGTSSSSTNTITSPTETLTVPAGNPGTIVFSVGWTDVTFNSSYSKNGSSFSTLHDGDIITFANNDTLAFKTTNTSESGDELQIIATDNTTNATIGTCTLHRN